MDSRWVELLLPLGQRSSQRSVRYNHGQSTSRSNSTRAQSRAAGPVDIAYEHRRQGSYLKEAATSLTSRVSQGLALNPYRCADVLRRCFNQRDSELVKEVHDCIIKSGLEDHPHVASHLLKGYTKCGRLQTAQELFDKLLNKDIVIWTIMIGGYAENAQSEDAVELYKQFRKEGGQPNAITYLTVLKACASPDALKWGRDIHVHILQDGFQEDMRVGNALVNMYGKCGSIEEARVVFDIMKRRDVVSWNSMICGLAQHGHGHEAFSLFQQMQREGFTPDPITYLCLLSARVEREDLAWVKEVHSYIIKAGLAQHLRVINALIFIYAKCGSMDDAKLVFHSMMNHDVISWNVMIGGLAEHGLGHEAFSWFLQMEREGFTPDLISYLSILNPCSSKGALEWVKEVHSHATKAGFDVDVRFRNALFQMYAKIGSNGDSRQVFEKLLNGF